MSLSRDTPYELSYRRVHNFYRSIIIEDVKHDKKINKKKIFNWKLNLQQMKRFQRRSEEMCDEN